MGFSVKKSEAPASGGEGVYLRSFPKGETTVRFLEEPDEWRLYYEHFVGQQSFPCTGDTNSCPGCTHDSEDVQRRSRKYGTFVYNTKWNDVVPYKLPMTLANRLTNRAEKNDGTITNRDYVVIRSGDGLRTEYDVDSDEKYTVDVQGLLRKANPSTIEEVLESMYKQVWGDLEVEQEPRAPKQASDRMKKEVKDDTPPWEEKAKDDEEITEAQLRSMTRSQLKEVWTKAGWDGWDDDWDKSEILTEIFKRAE